MSETSPLAPTVPRSLVYSCLIPHPAARQLLFLPRGGDWALPWWRHEGDDRPFWQTVDEVNRALRIRFDLDTPILRCVNVDHDPQRGRLEYIYESEPPPLAWALPSGGRWFGHDDLGRIPLADPTHRALLERWFSETGDAAVVTRRPALVSPRLVRRNDGLARNPTDAAWAGDRRTVRTATLLGALLPAPRADHRWLGVLQSCADDVRPRAGAHPRPGAGISRRNTHAADARRHTPLDGHGRLRRRQSRECARGRALGGGPPPLRRDPDRLHPPRGGVTRPRLPRPPGARTANRARRAPGGYRRAATRDT